VLQLFRRPFLSEEAAATLTRKTNAAIGGRGLHSSTFRLNVSTFCGIRWVNDFPLVYYTGRHREV
jgi:hypothetical protein